MRLLLINGELATAVLGPSALVVAVDSRFFLAEAARLNAFCVNSALHEVVADDDRTVFAERHIVFVRAALVAVTFNDDHAVGLLGEMGGDLINLADQKKKQKTIYLMLIHLFNKICCLKLFYYIFFSSCKAHVSLSEREEEDIPMGRICMEECALICANDY